MDETTRESSGEERGVGGGSLLSGAERLARPRFKVYCKPYDPFSGERMPLRRTGEVELSSAPSRQRSYPRHGGARYRFLKRALDMSVCLLSAPVVVPVLAGCAIAVRCSSRGPILFRQDRTGLGGRPFIMYKFRSMSVDAEKQKAELKRGEGVDGPDFKLKNDPRVTRVGAVLRKTSLDELPQLWNVLRGDMSLVGPRPTSFGVETYDRWHSERLEVKPGLTGFWQILARGDLDFDRRVRMDIAYVRQRSLSVDLWILLHTVPSVIHQRGAY
jgi:lipopolysaccharide/colanic/teichoic acid biosynthesis glycosyltransferase